MVDPPSMSSLKNGEESAWESAFRMLWPCAFRSAQHPAAGLTIPEAEDVACEALEKALHVIGRVENFHQLKALVARIAYCQAISLRRRNTAVKRGSGRTISANELYDTLSATHDGVHPSLGRLDQTDLGELGRLLQDGMQCLDEQAQSLLRAHYVEGLTYREIAEKYKLPIGTVCTKLARSLKRVRLGLDRAPNLLNAIREFLR